MKCGDAEKHLTAFVDGELDEQLRREIKAHIETCRECIEQALQIQQMWKWLGEEVEFTPNPFLAAKIQKRIQGLESQAEKWPIWISYLSRLLVPATAVAGLLLGLFLGSQLKSELFNGHVVNSSATEVINSSVAVFSDMPEGSLTAIYDELGLVNSET